MDVQGGLFSPLDVIPPDVAETREHAWRLLLPELLSSGFTNRRDWHGEVSEKIYVPFEEKIFFETGLVDYFLAHLPPKEALRATIRAARPTSNERFLRGKLSALEAEIRQLRLARERP